MLLTKQKPYRGAQLNWLHPLSRGLVGAWLFNEYSGGKVYNLIGQTTGDLTIRNGYYPYWNSLGLYLNRGYVQESYTYDLNTDSYTMFSIFKTPSTVAYHRPIIHIGSGSALADTKYSLWLRNTGVLYFFTYSTTYRNILSTLSFNFNEINCGACICKPSENVIDFFLNGEWDAGVACAYWPTGASILYHGFPDNTYYGDTTNIVSYMWNRALTVTEVESLSISPYQMFISDNYWLRAMSAVVAGKTYGKSHRLLMGDQYTSGTDATINTGSAVTDMNIPDNLDTDGFSSDGARHIEGTIT